MKKIYRLREWLTMDEAAGHLSMVLAEAVTVAELLRLALDGHLTLSVNLVNKARAHLGRVVPYKEVPLREMLFPMPGAAPDTTVMTPDGLPIDDVTELTPETAFLCLDDAVVGIEGVWDLTMRGAEKLDVEHAFQQLTDGPAVELIFLEGPLLCRPDGQWAQLQDRFKDREITLPDGERVRSEGSYYPASGLPQDAHLVVKMSALAEFQAKLLKPTASAVAEAAQLGTTVRETLLKLVIGMAVGRYRHDPVAARSPAPSAILSDLEEQGLSVSDDTIRKYLQEAAAKVLPKYRTLRPPNSGSS